jgi:hypothetical protein
MTQEQIGKAITLIALDGLLDEAIEKTKADICLTCLDRRCEQGRICKEFLRRSESYAWEIAARNAELN